jgi:hypothetical protein
MRCGCDVEIAGHMNAQNLDTTANYFINEGASIVVHLMPGLTYQQCGFWLVDASAGIIDDVAFPFLLVRKLRYRQK